jgi:thiol-disulfide isomerase/thioredoxin/outer membrane lipoprotein-sorting protein
MVAEYKSATSYDDKGYVSVRYQLRGQPRGFNANYQVALAPPNKFRIHAYGGLVVSDGQKLRALVMNMPEQILQLDAPPEATLASFFPNYMLADAMIEEPTRTFSWVPVQLVLLFADDPLNTLLHQSQAPDLLEPEKIDDRDCYRVRVRRDDGTGVLWIDQETYVLRRIEFPSEILRTIVAEREQAPRDEIENLRVLAELNDAQFGGEIDPQTFQFEMPQEVKLVDQLLPEAIRWLGKQVPEFSFVDLEGEPITRESLAGKIAVLDFWASWCQPCRMTLPDVDRVRMQYEDNEEVVFLAVSVDEPSVPDERLLDTFSEIGVKIPIARDPQQTSIKTLGVHAFPTQMILDAEGIIQFRQPGGDQPGLGAPRLAARLERLLAGEDLAEQTLQQYQQAREVGKKQFAELLETCIEDDLYVIPSATIPKAEIAERAEPKSLQVTQLWACTELAAPNNPLVLPRPDQAPRLLVIEQGNSIAEIATKGNVVSLKPLSLPPQEVVFFLRTGVGKDGERYFVGSALGGQQVHLWDEQFNLLMSFPETAPENPHAGIADVRIADLDGDGSLELALSYFGVVGVQGVSLEGERIWANKAVVESLRLVVLGPDADGKRSLLAVNSREGEMVVLDAQGQRKAGFTLGDRGVAWPAGADLDGDGQPELCALTALPDGGLEAVGFDLEGQQLWSYPLTPGAHGPQIEAVTAGKLLPGPSAQWLIASADGKIHILGADGKPIDVFTYGKELTGVAATQWDDKHVLLVSTTEGIDAWQVEPPGSR